MPFAIRPSDVKAAYKATGIRPINGVYFKQRTRRGIVAQHACGLAVLATLRHGIDRARRATDPAKMAELLGITADDAALFSCGFDGEPEALQTDAYEAGRLSARCVGLKPSR